MPQTSQSPEAKQYAQRRRWLKTSFGFTSKNLNYALESKNDAAVQRAVAWDTIAPRTSYSTLVEPDRELRWVAFVLSALAIVSVLRGGSQPTMLYLAVTPVFFLAVWLTAGWRRVSFTALPASNASIVVLEDEKHDAIIAAIEQARAETLLKAAEPAPGMSIRLYLRRLRWLVDAGVLSAQEFAQRQKLVLPDTMSLLLAPKAAPLPDQQFRQRKLGETIEVRLEADRLTHSRSTLFNGAETFSLPYAHLQEPQQFSSKNPQHELTAFIFCWLSIAGLACGAWISEGHHAEYYVGGEDLKNALTDFGPILLLIGAAAAIVPRLIVLRHTTPYPRIVLQQDQTGDHIRAAIEERRLATRRTLCEPDPLLTVVERVEQIDALYTDGVISAEERDRAVQRARFLGDEPAFDRPVFEISAPKKRRELALH
ncbi:hypothetical protein [Rhodoplanes sp. Z2-YC6860]|uniref:hypothetical protein n=1 Tax=Rhodoplanes sp. Z2-YC6860 TaxID=674703 RepID=UPI0012EE0AE3|nr:hypothetical protein [Rhodoplanes sp. Z2-YC6860]